MTLGAGHKDLRIVGCAGQRVLSCCGVVRPPEWSDFLASHMLLCEELVYIREAAPDLTISGKRSTAEMEETSCHLEEVR